MKRLRLSVVLADNWRPAIVMVVAVCLLVALLTFKLGSLTPGLSAEESSYLSTTTSLSRIADNPLFLVHKLGNWILLKAGLHGDFFSRLPSAVLGMIAVAAFFLILQQWHTTRVSSLATLLFATSSWFLSVARLAIPDISFVMLLVLMLGGVWLHKRQHTVFASFITALAAVSLLYVPAMLWLVIPALIWQRRRLKDSLQLLSVWWQALVIVLIIIGLAPLAWGLSQQPELIRTWLGLPDSWPTPLAYLRNLIGVPIDIFIRRDADAVYGIGRLPFIDVLTTVMVFFGAYAYAFRLKLDRTRLIFGISLLGAILISLVGPVKYSLLLPFVYILTAAGIALLLQQWFTVFPRNPLARGVAIGLMTAAVGMACFYHLTYYFVAWPNTPATGAAFSHEQAPPARLEHQ